MEALVTRFGRLMFALLAVWCLGCNSFEMLETAVTHDGNMTGCSDDAASHAPGQTPTIAAATTNQASAITVGCGCDHCVGTETMIARIAPVERLLPPPLNAIAQFPALVTREPAVPPPELLVAV